MAYPIGISTTATPIIFGPMILSSDHITATGDLHTTVTVTISKNGGAFGAPSGAITWLGSGWYAIAGNATDSNTAGPIAVHASVATNDPFDQTVAFVVDPTVAQFGANMVQANGQTISAAAGVTLPASVADNADLEELLVTVGAAGAGLTAIPLAGDFSATMKTSLQTAADAAITANITIIEINADVDELITTIGAAGAGLTAVGDTSGTTTLLSRVSATRAGYFDNLSGGAVALAVSLPSNFSALGITAGGKISEVVLTDTLTTYTGNAPQTGDTYALANGTSGFVALKGDTASILTDAAALVVGVNLARINNIPVNGAGTSGSPWGP